MAEASDIISVDEVCRLLETLNEWEEVGLHLGLSEKTIKEIRGVSGGISAHRIFMASRWLQSEELEPSWSKLEKALISVNQEALAAQIRARYTPNPPEITATTPSPSSESQKEAGDDETGS